MTTSWTSPANRALRAEAGLGREAMVVGVLSRFEIWSPEAWESFVRDSERLLDDATLDFAWPPAAAPSAPPAPASGRRLPQPKPSR